MPGNRDVEGSDKKTVCRVACEAKCRETILNYAKKYSWVPVTNQPSVKVFVTGNDYLTIIGYRHSLRSLLRLSL